MEKGMTIFKTPTSINIHWALISVCWPCVLNLNHVQCHLWLLHTWNIINMLKAHNTQMLSKGENNTRLIYFHPLHKITLLILLAWLYFQCEWWTTTRINNRTCGATRLNVPVLHGPQKTLKFWGLTNPYLPKPMKWTFWVHFTQCSLWIYNEQASRLKWKNL